MRIYLYQSRSSSPKGPNLNAILRAPGMAVTRLLPGKHIQIFKGTQQSPCPSPWFTNWQSLPKPTRTTSHQQILLREHQVPVAEWQHYALLHQPWQCCRMEGPSLLRGVVSIDVSSLNLSRRGGEGWSGKWDTFLVGNALSGDSDMDSNPDYTTCSFSHRLLWISVVDKIRISAPISEGYYDKKLWQT